MQLGGSIYMALMITLVLTALFATGHGMSGGGSLIIIGCLGAGRSALHRAAGRAILYGNSDAFEVGGPFKTTMVYIIVAFVHSVIALAILDAKLDLGGKGLFALAAILLAWPVTLLIVSRQPRFREIEGELPASEDRGFEGTSLLMLVFGLAGGVFAVTMLIVTVRLPGPHLLTLPGVGMLGLAATLLVRSIHHARAGGVGVSAAPPMELAAAVTRYTRWGMGSAIGAAAVFAVIMLQVDANGATMLQATCLVYLLLIWPLIVRQFFNERGYSAFIKDDNLCFTRAPDRGLTTLGWLLLALGVLGLAGALPGALFGASGSFGYLAGFDMLTRDMAASFGRSQWWSVLLSAAQIWAAVELVTMGARHRQAAYLYSGLAIAVTVHVALPLLDDMKKLGGGFAAGIGDNLMFGQVALALVVPITTIVLLRRSYDSVAPARLVSHQRD